MSAFNFLPVGFHKFDGTDRKRRREGAVDLYGREETMDRDKKAERRRRRRRRRREQARCGKAKLAPPASTVRRPPLEEEESPRAALHGCQERGLGTERKGERGLGIDLINVIKYSVPICVPAKTMRVCMGPSWSLQCIGCCDFE